MFLASPSASHVRPGQAVRRVLWYHWPAPLATLRSPTPASAQFAPLATGTTPPRKARARLVRSAASAARGPRCRNGAAKAGTHPITLRCSAHNARGVRQSLAEARSIRARLNRPGEIENSAGRLLLRRGRVDYLSSLPGRKIRRCAPLAGADSISIACVVCLWAAEKQATGCQVVG